MLRTAVVPTLALLFAGCAPNPDPPTLTSADDVGAFVAALEASLEAHAWQEILAVADPNHFHTQVVEMGMSEPQYVAELLGLHRVDNTIEVGEELEWADLARIESAALDPATGSEPPIPVTGTVTLTDGSTLEIMGSITRERQRLLLTGGVG